MKAEQTVHQTKRTVAAVTNASNQALHQAQAEQIVALM
jgi:hypothetical protein